MKDPIGEHYGDHYKLYKALNEISDLRQTGTVQKYMNHINRLNVYTNMTYYHLINNILNCVTPGLHQVIAYYEDPCSDL